MKKYALAGLFAPLLFLVTYLTLSTLRPEYSHLTKAISELGDVDAPYKWWWNIFGYGLTGLLIALFALGLYRHIKGQSTAKIVLVSLALSGILMTFSGIFPGDFEERSSATMLLHTVGSIGSFIAFMIAAFTLPIVLKKHYYWKKATGPSLALAWLSILSGFLRSGDMPGLGQRLGFTFYFLWIAYLAIKALKAPLPGEPNAIENHSQQNSTNEL
ncbi:DUF998 domain-containing protein [Roseivirga sp. UBA1976]|uniref:DUF998 domain-containing protein n=1 Tax=Roseivirga sp. UBA1976 TaxID=1947386 RepID=UPI00257B50A3|nr:DUF998 domain-containing protein [Roseivirga sp. UBA1976]|tara:strand:+ start:2170 stop:2814 length:645 start_codon:yes stop_codon:yes gene_type:complete